MYFGVMKTDELDYVLARLRHLICKIEEIIDEIEKLKLNDVEELKDVSKGTMDDN